MLEYTLIVVLVLALSLAVAGVAIRRVHPLLAATLGLLPMLIMQIAFQWANSASFQACLESACASSGLPANCGVGEFGCGEGYGLSMAALIMVGIAQLIIYSIGFIPIWVIHSRRIAATGTARYPAGDQTVR